MMEKEKWIDDIMQSIKDQSPAEANPFMHTRVMAKLSKPNDTKMPLRWVLAVSFCVAVLLCLNILLFTKNPTPVNDDGIHQVMTEYGLTDTDIYSTSLSNE